MMPRDWFYRQMVLLQGKGLSPAEKADHLYGNFVQIAAPALERSIAAWVAGQEGEINMEAKAAQKALAQWIMEGGTI